MKYADVFSSMVPQQGNEGGCDHDPEGELIGEPIPGITFLDALGASATGGDHGQREMPVGDLSLPVRMSEELQRRALQSLGDSIWIGGEGLVDA